MRKEYEKPEIEVIDLVSEEEIAIELEDEQGVGSTPVPGWNV